MKKAAQILLALSSAGMLAYFILPENVKTKLLALLRNNFLISTAQKTISENWQAAKETAQEKIDSLILPPAKQREKLLNKLEDRFSAITNENLPPAVQKIIEESQKIISELKDKNEDSGIVQTAAQKILSGEVSTKCP